jgi:hypothetical protein
MLPPGPEPELKPPLVTPSAPESMLPPSAHPIAVRKSPATERMAK